MIPVSQDYISSKCEIKTMENILILTGYINEVDDEAGSLEILNSVDNIALIKFNTKVKINIFNAKLGFLSVVGETFTSTKQLLKVSNVKLLANGEARSYFRMGLSDEIVIFKLDEATKGNLDSAVAHAVQMKDVSLGGFRFWADVDVNIQLHEKYIADFELEDRHVIFKFEVLRKYKVNEDNNQYGCRFFETTPKSEQDLCKFMFKKQREQIQKQRERMG